MKLITKTLLYTAILYSSNASSRGEQDNPTGIQDPSLRRSQVSAPRLRVPRSRQAAIGSVSSPGCPNQSPICRPPRSPPTPPRINSAAGLAFVGGNGITAYVGSNLLTFQSGLEAIASVIAHEIGHNLGLPHIVEAENLMQAGGSPNEGERLNEFDNLLSDDKDWSTA